MRTLLLGIALTALAAGPLLAQNPPRRQRMQDSCGPSPWVKSNRRTQYSYCPREAV